MGVYITEGQSRIRDYSSSINNTINRICINSNNSSRCTRGIIGISAISAIAGMSSKACLGERCHRIRQVVVGQRAREGKEEEREETRCGRHVRYEHI